MKAKKAIPIVLVSSVVICFFVSRYGIGPFEKGYRSTTNNTTFTAQYDCKVAEKEKNTIVENKSIFERTDNQMNTPIPGAFHKKEKNTIDQNVNNKTTAETSCEYNILSFFERDSELMNIPLPGPKGNE